MQKTIIMLPAIKLVGISCRTNNLAEMEPATAKIGTTIQKYVALSTKIKHDKPSTTYCVYTNYESDFRGNYTYFIGKEVAEFNNIPAEFDTLIIPAQNYTKFTTEPGSMPMVCIEMWKKIWNMNSEELGGPRKYLADFEIYDQRATNPEHTVLDIYIGINH
ncbi:MAG: GyrI-like domain-containing protein [Candidatus Amoebophilus sp.]